MSDSAVQTTAEPVGFTHKDVEAVMAAGRAIPTVRHALPCPDGLAGCLAGHYEMRWTSQSLTLFSIAKRILASVTSPAHDDTDLLLDVWFQFALSRVYKGERWYGDGSLSTLEEVAETLLARGVLIKHPYMDLYRRAPTNEVNHFPKSQ